MEMQILGIAGSLRAGSYNKLLLDAAGELAPEGMEISSFDLDRVPLYNRDVEDAGDPEPVRELKAAIAEADGLLIATPEYQYGIPGVLKNALDWASRPPESVLNGKPVATVGASPGITGTARAHLQLRQTLQYNEARMVIRPEVLVARARSKFDDEGRLVDETARELLAELLSKLAEKVREREALAGQLA